MWLFGNLPKSNFISDKGKSPQRFTNQVKTPACRLTFNTNNNHNQRVIHSDLKIQDSPEINRSMVKPHLASLKKYQLGCGGGIISRECCCTDKDQEDQLTTLAAEKWCWPPGLDKLIPCLFSTSTTTATTGPGPCGNFPHDIMHKCSTMPRMKTYINSRQLGHAGLRKEHKDRGTVWPIGFFLLNLKIWNIPVWP